MDGARQALCAQCGSSEGDKGRQRGMIPCDGGCGLTFHLRCVGLRSFPAGDWFCAECVEEEEGEEGEAEEACPSSTKMMRPTQKKRSKALKALQQRHWAG